HLVEARPRSRDERELHRDEVLAHDAEPRDAREGVLRRAHAALDAVLDRDHRADRATRDNVVEGLADVVDAAPAPSFGFGDLSERGPRERAGGTQVAVALEVRGLRHDWEPTGGARLDG